MTDRSTGAGRWVGDESAISARQVDRQNERDVDVGGEEVVRERAVGTRTGIQGALHCVGVQRICGVVPVVGRCVHVWTRHRQQGAQQEAGRE